MKHNTWLIEWISSDITVEVTKSIPTLNKYIVIFKKKLSLTSVFIAEIMVDNLL